MIKTHVIAY